MRITRTEAQYEPLREGQFYIDKTEALEKGIAVFPSIYVMGAAASGKTTAVKMLLKKHSGMKSVVLWIKAEAKDPGRFCGKLKELESHMEMQEEALWVVFEDMPGRLPAEMAVRMADFLSVLSGENRAVLIGREYPDYEFLKLIWQRKMELLPQEVLLFTKSEIREFIEYIGSPLTAERLYEETGGWAGCVDMMIRMSCLSGMPRIPGKGREEETCDIKRLRKSYEISSYIQKEILDTLSEGEQEIMRRAAVCPWINEELCEEVWGIQWAAESLEKLGRKGIFLYDSRQRRWRIAPLFRDAGPEVTARGLGQDSIRDMYGDQANNGVPNQPDRFWIRLGEWYESHGFLREALSCIRLSGDDRAVCSCMLRSYRKIPFLGVPYEEVMEWSSSSLELCYLRGMYCYFHQDLEGLGRETARVRKLKCDEKQKLEILLNLTYVNPGISLEEWLGFLEECAQKAGPFSLYDMLGNSITYLCGLRDLSGLFACSKKEENRMARLWRESLGEEENIGYCLARIDFYLEIRQKEAVREEEWDILRKGTEQDFWQFRLVRMYLLCKIQGMQPNEDAEELIGSLGDSLLREENEVCVRNTEVIRNLLFYWNNKREKFSLWLQRSGENFRMEVNEENYFMLFALAKGCMFINQYDKAEKIQRKLIPYLKVYRRTYLLAALLFQNAIVNWEAGKHSQALKSVIESFMVNGNYRYVRMYTEFGKQGCDVLEAYVEWIRSSAPEGWHRKKKYNYGNVLRMPVEDYLEAVLRHAKREARSVPMLSDKSVEEKLTMMETIILQDIGLGITNAEICKELNLKLPTVKSHIYSLYKKLNVNSRVQAVLKGKELGILK